MRVVLTKGGHSRITKKLRIPSALSSLLAVGTIVSSSGCATPTRYQKLTGRFGYNDFRIAADIFEVTFSGNGRTPWETVSSYVMRRAAEVTILHGFSHFIALDRADQTKTYIRGTDQVTATVVRPAIRLRVRCFKNPLPDSSELIDARDFLIFNYPEALWELETLATDPSPVRRDDQRSGVEP